MMRLPYYLYTYQRAAQETESDRPAQPMTLGMPGLLLVGCVVWVAVLALAVFGQW